MFSVWSPPPPLDLTPPPLVLLDHLRACPKRIQNAGVNSVFASLCVISFQDVLSQASFVNMPKPLQLMLRNSFCLFESAEPAVMLCNPRWTPSISLPQQCEIIENVMISWPRRNVCRDRTRRGLNSACAKFKTAAPWQHTGARCATFPLRAADHNSRSRLAFCQRDTSQDHVLASAGTGSGW